MNIIRRIVEALNPCIHQWDVVDTLKDNPENPRTVNIIRACNICGTIDQQTIVAPTAQGCPPHKWVNVSSIKIVDDVNAAATGKPFATMGFKITQQCSGCGELRTKQVGN